MASFSISSIVCEMLRGVDAGKVFLYNITVEKTVADWWEYWEAKLRVIYTLAKFGSLVNLYKCKFLVFSTGVLGFELFKQGYLLG